MDQSVRVDATLQVGTVEQQVTVTADAPLVQQDSSTAGQVIGPTLISKLPLNERNFLNFALLVPGAAVPTEGSQNSTQGGSVNVNGAREQMNNFLLDGTDNNDQFFNRYSALPSVEALEEFKVQSSTSSPSMGGTPERRSMRCSRAAATAFTEAPMNTSAIASSTPRIFSTCRSAGLLMRPATCGPIPRYQRSQYGATLGGPIVKDRSFFFAAFENLALRQATTRESTVPSQQELAFTFAALPPPFRNPAGVNALKLYPAANVGANLQTSTRFVASPIIRTGTSLGSVKLDQQINGRNILSGHYSISNQSTYNPFDPGFAVSNLPGFGTNVFYRGQNIGANWVRVLNPRATNSLRGGYNRDHIAFAQQSQGIDRSTQLGFTAPPSALDFGYPYIQVTGFENLGEPDTAPENSIINTIQISDDVSWNPALQGGRHHFKFGAEYRHIRDDGYFSLSTRGQWLFLGAATGNPLADLLLGAPAAVIFGQGSSVAKMTTS